MKKHLKFVLYLAAIALVAVLIFNLRSQVSYGKAPALEKISAREFLGVRLLDIFLGILGLAFVGVAAGYVRSLAKGGGQREVAAVEGKVGGGPASGEALPPKKLILEKALGRTGAKILGALFITILILVVLAAVFLVVFLLVGEKIPFLRDLFAIARP